MSIQFTRFTRYKAASPLWGCFFIVAALALLTGCQATTPTADIARALPSGRIAKAEAHYLAGENTQAETILKALVLDFPELDQAWFYLGNLAFRRDAISEAKFYWLNAVEQNPRHSEAQHNLGMLNLQEAYERIRASLRDATLGYKRDQLKKQLDWLERFPR